MRRLLAAVAVTAAVGLVGVACLDAEGSNSAGLRRGQTQSAAEGANATSERDGGLATQRAAPQEGADKHALIIAIARYPRESGYSNLNSNNDVPLVRAGLEAQGFPPENIVELRDEEATKEGIVRALEELEERVEPGDVVVIHYSGHGHRITDQNGDELDGFDELLVPHGAPNLVDRSTAEQSSYDGAAHLRDEEFGQHLASLRRRAGPDGNVAVFIDACFSGTATRGYELPVRGMAAPIGTAASTMARGAGDEEGSGLSELASLGMRSGGGADDPSLAPFTLITATRANELDHERYGPDGEIVGPLSLALRDVLPKVGPETTYRALFDLIKRHMADVEGQTPQLEGDADTRVFNGRAVEQAPYVEILEAPGEGERAHTIVVGGGRLAGLLAGTRVALYPRGTVDPSEAERRAEGTVTASHETDAEVVMDRPIEPELAEESWAFVTQFGLGDRRFRVFLDESLGAAARDRIEAALAALERVEIARGGAQLAVVDSAGHLLVKRAAQNRTLGDPIPADDGAPARVRERILAHARFLDLQEIEFSDPRYDVALEIVPVRHARRGGRRVCGRSEVLASSDERLPGGYLTFGDGDDYLFRVHNRGEADAYLTVIELLPNGTIQQLVPRAGNVPERIPAGTSRTLVDDCFIFRPPFGTEMIKLFATNEPVDFRPLLESQGLRTARGRPPTPLEKLFADSFSGVRGDPVNQALATGDTDVVMVRVVPSTRSEGGSQ